MVKLIFENCEEASIQDRFIVELKIEGATDRYRQVGERKYWAKSCEKVLLEFKPDNSIITDGLYDENDLIKRLDMFSDVEIIEVDGQTYYVPYEGNEVNILQQVEYLPNGNVRIIIGK